MRDPGQAPLSQNNRHGRESFVLVRQKDYHIFQFGVLCAVKNVETVVDVLSTNFDQGAKYTSRLRRRGWYANRSGKPHVAIYKPMGNVIVRCLSGQFLFGLIDVLENNKQKNLREKGQDFGSIYLKNHIFSKLRWKRFNFRMMVTKPVS